MINTNPVPLKVDRPLECHPRDPLEELSIPVEGSIILPVFMTLNSMELAAIHIADIYYLTSQWSTQMWYNYLPTQFSHYQSPMSYLNCHSLSHTDLERVYFSEYKRLLTLFPREMYNLDRLEHSL